MNNRNYRQAKRSREESRKKRQQEKLVRKASRGTASGPSPDTESNVVASPEKAAS